MSRWGEDIFESDLASDYLHELVYRIQESINECLDDSVEHSYDALLRGEAILMPGVDVLRTLCNAYPPIILHLVREMPVGEWRKWYLQVFDAEVLSPDEQSDPGVTEFRKVQRQHIVESFSELEKMLEN